MIKYILLIVLIMIVCVVFIYKAIGDRVDSLEKTIELKDEKFKDLLKYNKKKLKEEIIKITKELVNAKEISGEIKQIPTITVPEVILCTKKVINVGEIVKVENRYVRILSINSICVLEEKYEYIVEYIA